MVFILQVTHPILFMNSYNVALAVFISYDHDLI